MKVEIQNITGFEDAFKALFISKRTLTQELSDEINNVCESVLDRRGRIKPDAPKEDVIRFNEWLGKLLRWGKHHITLIRFLNISIMTWGMHRAGQDDIDSHAKRFENKIIRSSTRLANFNQNEMSDYYKDKIMNTDQVLKVLNITTPDRITIDKDTYVKTVNGYIKEEYVDNKDVKRGLYMLSIPSDFVSQINLCEWGHVFKERSKDGGANPEVKEWAEAVTAALTNFHDLITREYILSIKN